MTLGDGLPLSLFAYFHHCTWLLDRSFWHALAPSTSTALTQLFGAVTLHVSERTELCFFALPFIVCDSVVV